MTITPEMAFPTYSQRKSGNKVIYCPNFQLYDLIRESLQTDLGEETLPSLDHLIEEHKMIDTHFDGVVRPDEWGDWFDFTIEKHTFHIHLSWMQCRDTWGELTQKVTCECYLTGDGDSRTMRIIDNILENSDILFIPYIVKDQPFIRDIIA